MNELNKLLTSLILLGAGFFAASLVGPPEVIDRLSRYLRPSGPAVTDGLRPLAANTPSSADAWPDLAPSAPATAPSANQVAPVAAMVPPSTWPGEAPTPNVGPASPWGADAPSAFESAPSSQDWFTSATISEPSTAPTETPPAGRPLTPVPRSSSSRDAAPTAPAPTFDEPSSAEPDGWPELRAPLPPAEAPYATAAPREVQAAKPTLPENPYGARPRFDATSTNFDSDFNPLRYDAAAGGSIDPIQRRPTGDVYVKHIVTDGDTLPAIAERYLGDASRAQELFELNSDRLEHPDVLPIGMVLRAPKGRPSHASTPPAAVSGYPRLERPGDFATVSATEAYLPPLNATAQRPLTPIGSSDDRPLTAEQRQGPIDAVFQKEFAWDANGW